MVIKSIPEAFTPRTGTDKEYYMKRTRLPFKYKISPDENVVVDMSQLNFDSDDKEKAAIIYLRNQISPNIELDFSSCAYARKEKLLTCYLMSNFYFKQFAFINATIELVAKYLSLNSSTSYFTSEESDLYIEAHKDLLEEIASIYSSTLLFLLPDDKRDKMTKEKRTKFVGKNIRFLYDNHRIDELIINSNRQPVLYKNLLEDSVFIRNLYRSPSTLPLVVNAVENTDSNTMNQIILRINKMLEEGE